MVDLFEQTHPPLFNQSKTGSPLADVLRPKQLEDVMGQPHLMANGAILSKMVQTKQFNSLILWGPPGCGKTTIARLLAHHTENHFEQVSAIFTGIADLKKIFETARFRKLQGQRTLLFVDEIHRFNKAQQDAFLPYVEDGTIILIGATTENPSFELNSALLSRCQVLILKRLDDEALSGLLDRAEQFFDKKIPLNLEAIETLKAVADGDGRYFLTMIEQVFTHHEGNDFLGSEDLLKIVQRRAPLYDKGDDAHYNLISALHKSVRGSDVDAALYWFARMLDGGEDPTYIARRLIRMAVEDIGLADPMAHLQCLAAAETYERLGSPEGELALSQAVIYLATAPKSNANYVAYKAALALAQEQGSLMPPKHILNAPTQMMKKIGYGAGYQYDPDTKNGFSGQDYFPDEMDRVKIYAPPDKGFEREINKRLSYWESLRSELKAKKDTK